MSNAHFFDLVNDQGRPFTAVFEPGDVPGNSKVAFYDAADDAFTYPGQFTGGRYYVDTIMEHRGGLQLHGGVDVWRLSEMNVLDMQAWLITISS